MRTTNTTVMFHYPFYLKGLDHQQPPGRYAVSSDEEEIVGLNSMGWRRVETSIRLPALDRPTGIEQVHIINPFDLDSALTRDLLMSARPDKTKDGAT